MQGPGFSYMGTGSPLDTRPSTPFLITTLLGHRRNIRIRSYSNDMPCILCPLGMEGFVQV